MQNKFSLLKSFKCAIDGVITVLKEERNIKIHSITTLLVILLGLKISLSTIEWGIIILCITSVISFEYVNSAIERICDFIHPDQHIQIKHIKDIAAGATLLSSIGAALVGSIIFIPKLYLLWN